MMSVRGGQFFSLGKAYRFDFSQTGSFAEKSWNAGTLCKIYLALTYVGVGLRKKFLQSKT